MSARQVILARVRRALDGVDRDVVVPRDYRRPVPPGSPVDLFAERVADYRATVVICTAVEVEQVLAAAVAGRRVVVPEGLPWAVPGVPDEGLTHDRLDLLGGVVTNATVGIAETGTIVLDHGPGQGRRALSLVPDLHVCVVRASQVVPGVLDAVALLDPARPQTWISGPSATSDIELNRVEGVHGPRTLHVVLVLDA